MDAITRQRTSLLKHVADTQQEWFRSALAGPSAFDGGHGADVDWNAIAAADAGDEVEWQDTRFVLSDDETLDGRRTMG